MQRRLRDAESIRRTVADVVRESSPEKLDDGFRWLRRFHDAARALERIEATGGASPRTLEGAPRHVVGRILFHRQYGKCVTYGWENTSGRLREATRADLDADVVDNRKYRRPRRNLPRSRPMEYPRRGRGVAAIRPPPRNIHDAAAASPRSDRRRGISTSRPRRRRDPPPRARAPRNDASTSQVLHGNRRRHRILARTAALPLPLRRRNRARVRRGEPERPGSHAAPTGEDGRGRVAAAAARPGPSTETSRRRRRATRTHPRRPRVAAATARPGPPAQAGRGHPRLLALLRRRDARQTRPQRGAKGAVRRRRRARGRARHRRHGEPLGPVDARLARDERDLLRASESSGRGGDGCPG